MQPTAPEGAPKVYARAGAAPNVAAMANARAVITDARFQACSGFPGNCLLVTGYVPTVARLARLEPEGRGVLWACSLPAVAARSPRDLRQHAPGGIRCGDDTNLAALIAAETPVDTIVAGN